MSRTQREQDEDLVRELLEQAEEQERHGAAEYAESLASWLEKHDTLTDKQRNKAEEILEELEERAG